MKTELSKIAKDLEQGTITDNEARSLLLGLLGVSESNSFDIHKCINDVCDAVEAKIAYISPIRPKGNGSFRWLVKQAIDKMLYSRQR